MTDHRRWLELAALRPTFTLEPPDAAALEGHLASCEACSRDAAGLRADLAVVARFEVPPPSTGLRERVREAAAAADSAGGSRTLATVAVVGLLAAAALGATLGVGAFLSQRNDPISQLPNDPLALDTLRDKRILWTTEVVTLGADSITIDANGKTLHAETAAMKVGGDSGSLTSWTLEVVWFEAALEQRINLYFKADTLSWWIDEVRVYDSVGGPKSKWASFPRGPHFRTLLGQPFSGDIDLVGQGAAGPVRLRIDGAVLAVAPQRSFAQPPGGGAPLTRDPFAGGGPLRCSGILQLRPSDAERALQGFGYRLSWRLEYSTGPNTGYAETRLSAPDGIITGTELGPDGELIVFVSDPAKPSGVPASTFPPDCPPLPSG